MLESNSKALMIRLLVFKLSFAPPRKKVQFIGDSMRSSHIACCSGLSNLVSVASFIVKYSIGKFLSKLRFTAVEYPFSDSIG